MLERTELGPKTYFYCTKEKIPFLKVATNLDKIDFDNIDSDEVIFMKLIFIKLFFMKLFHFNYFG